MKNKDMITEILIKAKAGGCYMSGDLFFALAFRTEEELIAICNELGIKTN